VGLCRVCLCGGSLSLFALLFANICAILLPKTYECAITFRKIIFYLQRNKLHITCVEMCFLFFGGLGGIQYVDIIVRERME
jgi:hypothetical protein